MDRTTTEEPSVLGKAWKSEHSANRNRSPPPVAYKGFLRRGYWARFSRPYPANPGSRDLIGDNIGPARLLYRVRRRCSNGFLDKEGRT